ncbi:plasmid replication protein RepC [Mycoplana sp. MJR14]|jgi:replication initiation protein RepC|uniref:plasmid replication protein RepC n=1 Tax=Mycoplana sp. MJR14 TaxID=3032583 RepID=UPI000DD8B67C|nr:plasmid replication protein RepC [Mycoplana sp. MJR14]MDF1631257.1 plasmid replication protein RepC [Mycoplana sp. MJR14]
MVTGTVTTPFGRRSISLALVRRQKELAEIREGKTADKWQVFRDACAAMDLLGIQSNSLAVLNALLSFYPNNELRQDAPLIVFPSNIQLALRAHGMSGATLRRHLAILVETGLIVRKDSANGKRYARKDGTGQIENAFGFDLSPLLARSEELAMLAQKVAEDRSALRAAKEALTICRRDIRKLITAAIEEGAPGDWQTAEATYLALVRRIPRVLTTDVATSILGEMQALRADVVNCLETQENAEEMSGNDAQIERHIQNSNPDSSIELEPRSEREPGARAATTNRLNGETIKAFPLGIVLKACPSICDYGPGGGIASWRDLRSAAVVVRSMLGISPSAYQDACEAMGPENAAATIACILERANFINSPGGYLRDLTRRTERGEFSLGPVIMALLRASGQTNTKTG